MPELRRGPEGEELERLIGLFLQAETDIINEIGRLRSLGLADYHAEAALERVQGILRRLENDCWEYVPKMIERQFYLHHPEARRPLPEPETPEKHQRAYENAGALSGEQMDIVQRLTANLMGEITEAGLTVTRELGSVLLGRREEGALRRVGLEQTAAMQAAGRGAYRALPGFVEAVRREGVTAFIDKAGRRWSLHAYGSMALRTASRQAEVLSVLCESPEQDLYQISRHGTTCGLCAPFEGRVYSKSGKDPDFPPLSAAFGKVDPDGPEDLSNTWLNIHPNCRHVLLPWTPAGRTEEEIQAVKDFSDPRKNPFDRDPRSREQIEAYRKKEAARAKWLRDYRQWERYREILGDRAPKTFATFQRIKYNNTDRWSYLKSLYRENHNYLQTRLDYKWAGEELFIPANSVIISARTIAGAGSKAALHVEPRLIEQFGGVTGEWKKRVGKISSDRYDFDVHWYELNGKQYETKVKYRGDKQNGKD